MADNNMHKRNLRHEYVDAQDGSGRCFYCTAPEEYVQHAPKIDPSLVVPENIAEEAARVVYGDREQTYGDPNINFDKLAHMWTGHLLKKLQPGTTITASDVAIMQVLLKISREGFRPKRDNRVDMIGYVLCLDRIVQQNEGNSVHVNDE